MSNIPPMTGGNRIGPPGWLARRSQLSGCPLGRSGFPACCGPRYTGPSACFDLPANIRPRRRPHPLPVHSRHRHAPDARAREAGDRSLHRPVVAARRSPFRAMPPYRHDQVSSSHALTTVVCVTTNAWRGNHDASRDVPVSPSRKETEDDKANETALDLRRGRARRRPPSFSAGRIKRGCASPGVSLCRSCCRNSRCHGFASEVRPGTEAKKANVQKVRHYLIAMPERVHRTRNL